MGRIAGVTADETKRRLLATAAEVFARLGYEGASIAQITAESGLSSGAIYAHFASKAELFVATIRAHAEDEFERVLGTSDVLSFIVARGQALDGHTAVPGMLLEVAVAAQRHPEVAQIMASSMGDRERQLTELLRAAQDLGQVDPTLPARAAIRLALMVALGSHVANALQLEPIDHDEWTRLIDRLVGSVEIRPGVTKPVEEMT